jgi:3,4-dihydroxy 2-butanone 4-phosphate synthase / GTP cyclohydrolase II
MIYEEMDIYSLHPQNSREGRGSAFVWGDLETLAKRVGGPLVRMHSKCVYGEFFQSDDCDCLDQKDAAIRMMKQQGGILFYLIDHEGRGQGQIAKARGYALKEGRGLNTVAASEKLDLDFDIREYGHCARFLVDYSIDSVQLLTNNLRKMTALTAAGITVSRRSLIISTPNSVEYQRTKRDLAGHLFPKSM